MTCTICRKRDPLPGYNECGYCRDAHGGGVLRVITGNTWGLRCTRCRLMFEDETEGEDHLNGPMCEKLES